jgi:hypothetical protein
MIRHAIHLCSRPTPTVSGTAMLLVVNRCHADDSRSEGAKVRPSCYPSSWLPDGGRAGEGEMASAL